MVFILKWGHIHSVQRYRKQWFSYYYVLFYPVFMRILCFIYTILWINLIKKTLASCKETEADWAVGRLLKFSSQCCITGCNFVDMMLPPQLGPEIRSTILLSGSLLEIITTLTTAFLYDKVGWSFLTERRNKHWHLFIYKASVGKLPSYVSFLECWSILNSLQLLADAMGAHTRDDLGKTAFTVSKLEWNNLQIKTYYAVTLRLCNNLSLIQQTVHPDCLSTLYCLWHCFSYPSEHCCKRECILSYLACINKGWTKENTINFYKEW